MNRLDIIDAIKELCDLYNYMNNKKVGEEFKYTIEGQKSKIFKRIK